MSTSSTLDGDRGQAPSRTCRRKGAGPDASSGAGPTASPGLDKATRERPDRSMRCRRKIGEVGSFAHLLTIRPTAGRGTAQARLTDRQCAVRQSATGSSSLLATSALATAEQPDRHNCPNRRRRVIGDDASSDFVRRDIPALAERHDRPGSSMHGQHAVRPCPIGRFAHLTGNLSLTPPCHGRSQVHAILGIRPPAGEGSPGPDSQDRMDQRDRGMLSGRGKESVIGLQKRPYAVGPGVSMASGPYAGKVRKTSAGCLAFIPCPPVAIGEVSSQAPIEDGIGAGNRTQPSRRTSQNPLSQADKAEVARPLPIGNRRRRSGWSIMTNVGG